MHYAPDVDDPTFAHRLEFTIKPNWKNTIDNFLERYCLGQNPKWPMRCASYLKASS